jgi:hypothetical protein
MPTSGASSETADYRTRSHDVNRTGLSHFFAAALPLIAFVSVSACNKDQPPTQTPQQPYVAGYQGQPGAYPQQPGYTPQPGYTAQPGYAPQPTTPQPGYTPGYAPQPTTPQPATPQPGAQPSAQPGIPGFPFPIPGAPAAGGASGGTAAGGTAQPLDPSLASAATIPLATLGNQHAPGMAKEGNPVAGNFQAGQTLESTFTLQPGKCYTLVAQGVGITQLDLEIQYVTPVPGLAPTAGKSSTRGAQAVVGSGNGCIRPMSPFQAQAKFIVKATSGAGLAVAQLYSK